MLGNLQVGNLLRDCYKCLIHPECDAQVQSLCLSVRRFIPCINPAAVRLRLNRQGGDGGSPIECHSLDIR
jgi:hypothetical protein